MACFRSHDPSTANKHRSFSFIVLFDNTPHTPALSFNMEDQGGAAQDTTEGGGGAEAGDAPGPADGPPAVPVEDVEPEIVEDPISADKLAVQLKIASAFRLFDHENTNSVDVRWVGLLLCVCVLWVMYSYIDVQRRGEIHA